MTRTEITKGGDTANQQTYTTASVTLTAGRLYVLGIHNHDNPSGETAPASVATTGGAISFTIRESQPFNTEAANFRMLSFWSVVPGSTVTDTIVITLADNGTGCQWILLEYDGFDTSTPFGTPVKDAVDSGTSISATPGALANTDSFQLAFVAYNLISPADTISGTNWTRIGACAPLSGPNAALDYAENTAGTASQVTSSGSSGARGIIVVEIRAAAGGGGATNIDPGFIASAAAIFAPVLLAAEILLPGFIGATSQVFAAELVEADIIQPPAIAATSQVFAPAVESPAVIDAGFIASTAQVFAPGIGQGIQTGFIASTAVVFAPDLLTAVIIQPTHIQSTAQVFEPSTGGGDIITVGAFTPASQVFPPQFIDAKVLTIGGRIDLAPIVYAPEYMQGVGILPGFIAAGEYVFAPELIPNPGPDYAYLYIVESAARYGFTPESAPRLGFVDESGPRYGVAFEGIPT